MIIPHWIYGQLKIGCVAHTARGVWRVHSMVHRRPRCTDGIAVCSGWWVVGRLCEMNARARANCDIAPNLLIYIELIRVVMTRVAVVTPCIYMQET